ncbi:phosphatase PAP2 family protein [Mesoplasma photuris]|uniref:phosphatase PAP2 family protein n=1 Tax=Mesoplasma photuris TaxID=217731 RepID=UPI0004E18468|nr:phosphatase PAP2 family protein [Mesoplasma photuris]
MELKKQSKFSKWITVPMFGLIIIFSVLFIISSFYDFEIMQIFEKLLNYDFFRYFSSFWHEMGYTELIIPLVASGLVLVEYMYRYIKIDKKKDWQSKLFLFVLYAILISAFVIQLYMKWNSSMSKVREFPNGGPNIEFIRLVNLKELTIIISIIFTIQSAIMLTCIILLRFYFSKNKKFIQGGYWKPAIAVLLIFVIGYAVIGSLKIMSWRNFYSQSLESKEFKINWIANEYGLDIEWIKENMDKVYQVIGKPHEYQEWWEFNIFVPNGRPLVWNLNIFTNSAFPSGHVVSSSCTVMSMAYFITPNKKGVIKNKRKEIIKTSILYLGFIHMALMVFSFLINGSHYLSDTSFSYVWVIISAIIAYKIADKIANKVNKKLNK